MHHESSDLTPDGGAILGDLTAWRSAELTIAMTCVHVETMELLLGQQIIPLCEREIPCEGTE